MNSTAERIEPAERYFGSVRFFKNLIFIAVIVMIVIPVLGCILLQKKAQEQNRQIEALEARAETAEQEAETAAQRANTLEEALSSWPVISPEPLDYQLLYPDFYTDSPIPEQTAESGTIYLTFDDGPSQRTPEVLRILEEKEVKATFFVVGKEDAASLEYYRQIVQAGHTLGMHSYSHNYKTIYTSVEDFLADYYRLFTLLRDTTGVTPTVFRFPGGSLNSYNQDIYEEIIAEMLRRGFVYYDWSLSAEDAAAVSPKAENITAHILEGAQKHDRAVVLMHDSYLRTSTVQALPALIDGLREQGFTLKALDRSVKPISFAYRFQRE